MAARPSIPSQCPSRIVPLLKSVLPTPRWKDDLDNTKEDKVEWRGDDEESDDEDLVEAESSGGLVFDSDEESEMSDDSEGE